MSGVTLSCQNSVELLELNKIDAEDSCIKQESNDA